jgi:hypothetical protein
MLINKNDYPFDLIIEKPISQEQILYLCSTIFGLNSEHIIVLNDISAELDRTLSLDMVCVVDKVKGDFLTLAHFYPQDHSVKKKLDRMGNFFELGSMFAEMLECKCLVRDDIDGDLSNYEEDRYIQLEYKKERKVVYINDDLTVDNIYKLIE